MTVDTNFDSIMARLRDLNRPPDPPNEEAPELAGNGGFGESKSEGDDSTGLPVVKPTPVALVAALEPVLSRVDRSHSWKRPPGAKPFHTEEALSPGALSQHVSTNTARGACPILRGTSETRIALFDLDSHDGATDWHGMTVATASIASAMARHGLQPIAWRSGGGRGIHLFAVWDQPQDAHSVRQRLSAILAECGFRSGTGGVCANEVEIFPKQDAVPADGCGSMFILPGSGKSVPLDDLTFDPLPREAMLTLQWPTSKDVPIVQREVVRPSVAVPSGDYSELRALLSVVEPNPSYDSDSEDLPDAKWLTTLMVIHHETGGSEEGLEIADEWSARGASYAGRAAIEQKWASFSTSKDAVATIEYLRARARRVPAAVDEFEDLTSESPQPEKPAKRTIKLRTGAQPAALTAIGETLAAGAPYLGLMIFSGAIAKAYLVPRKGFRGEVVQSLELNRLTPLALAADLNELADFVRVKPAKAGSFQTVRQDCPPDLARVFMDRPERWLDAGLPFVDRICETPIVLDSRIYSAAGFCSEAGAWIHCPPDLQLHEPLNRQNALAALTRVREWLSEFPFENPIDESVALAALLTAAMRASLPCAPGFVIDKPDYGAGASTLCKLVHIVLTGRKPAVLSVDRGEEELSKAIDAAQMAGASALVLDNVPSGEKLRSLAVTQVLSEPFRKPRVLGASRTVTVACTQLVLVTGVNVGVADDLVRRFLRCRIDPHCDRPQERTFFRPALLEEAEARRAEILSDLYTVIVTYQQVGVTARTNALAGFEEWASKCAAPLVWLGMPDPVISSSALQAEDPGRTDLAAVIEGWIAAYGETSVTVAELMSEEHFDGPRAECRVLLMRAAGCERVADASRAVGKFLARRKGAMIGGRRICHMGSMRNVALWSVRP